MTATKGLDDVQRALEQRQQLVESSRARRLIAEATLRETGKVIRQGRPSCLGVLRPA